jgi:hypothetical protein
MEYGGVLVDIGAYQACVGCERLDTKPLPELQRMAQIVPDERLVEYREGADVERLVDRIQQLAERQHAGWAVEYDRLEPWEAELLVHWLNLERGLERTARQIQTEVLLQALLRTRMSR